MLEFTENNLCSFFFGEKSSFWSEFALQNTLSLFFGCMQFSLVFLFGKINFFNILHNPLGDITLLIQSILLSRLKTNQTDSIHSLEIDLSVSLNAFQ